MSEDLFHNPCRQIGNRIQACPACAGKLSFDRHPYLSERGVIHRKRLCGSCQRIWYTKQGAEELTGGESPEYRKPVPRSGGSEPPGAARVCEC